MLRAIWPARCFSAFIGNEPSSRVEHLKRDCRGCAFPWQLWEVEPKGDRPWRGRENPSLHGVSWSSYFSTAGWSWTSHFSGSHFLHYKVGTAAPTLLPKALWNCFVMHIWGMVHKPTIRWLMMMWGFKSCMILYILCCVVLGCRADEVHKWKHFPAHHKPGWRVCTTVNTWPRKPHKNKQSRTSRSLSEKKSDSGSHDPLLNPS